MTKKKNLWWRPTKFNEKIVGKLIDAFRRDATVEEACAYAKINKDTYYEWMRKNKKFSDEIEQAKLFPHMFAKTKYFEALNSKDSNLSFKAALEYLRRRNPERKDKAENINFNNNTEQLNEEDEEILNNIRKKLNEWK